MALTRAVSDFKDSVKAATTTNITLDGGAPTTVDGISLLANDSVLVKSQTDPTQNGLYRVTTLGTGSNGSWTRRSDFNASNQVSAGALIFVEQGSINGNIFYYLPGGLGTVTIGSTALNFSNLFTTISSDISTGGGGGTTYSNTNVAAYLSTFQGALTANNFNAVAVYANTIGNSGATFVGSNATLSNALTANNFNAVAVYAGTIGNAGSNLVGTLLTATQTNITSVGTLSSLTVNGAITGNSFTGIAVYAGTIGNSGATLVGTLNGAANGPLNGTLGATTPNSVVATSITTTNGGQVTGYHSGAIGANTANTGAFTTLTTTGNITATGYIVPSANVTYDLGTPTLRWRTLYLSGNTIDLGGTSLSLGAGGLLVPSLTANASVLGNTFAGIAVYANTIGNTGATLVGAIGTNAQPYITSVGTLTSLAVSGAVTANTFTGVAVYAGTIGNTGATLTGTLSTVAQPNITSVGTLSSLSVSGAFGASGTSTLGAVNASTISAGTIGNAGASLQGASIAVTGASTANSYAAISVYASTIGNTGSNLVGTINTNAQPYINSVGTLSSLTVSGTTNLQGTTNLATINANTLNASSIGNSSTAFTGTSATIGGTVNANTIQAGTIGNTGATLTGTLSTAAQTNITSVGTLTSLAVTGNTSTGNLVVNASGGVYSPNYYFANGLSIISVATAYGNTQVGAYLTTYNGTIGSVTTSTVSAGTIGNSGAVLYGTLNSSSASQPNITTLAGLTNFGTVGQTTIAAGNLTVSGNLVVNGNNVSIGSSTLSISDPIINLHTPSDLTPLSVDDGADIGIKFHYYSTILSSGDSAAFVGRAHDTGYLEWYDTGSDVANVFTGTTYGTIKSGGLVLANTTVSNGITSGALRVSGGAGIAGAVYANNFNGVSVYA